MALVYPDIPSIKGSIEAMFFRKIGFEISYSQKYTDKFFRDMESDSNAVNAEGHSIYYEFKYYDPFKFNILKIANNAAVISYLGLTYKKIYDLKNRMKYYSAPTDSVFRLDYYAVQRDIHILAAQTGVVLNFGRITTEIYMDGGIKHRHQKLLYNEFDPEKDSYPDGLWPWERPFKGYLPSFSFGFKAGIFLFSMN